MADAANGSRWPTLHFFLGDARPLFLDSCRLFGPQGSYERDIVQTLIRVELSILQRASDQRSLLAFCSAEGLVLRLQKQNGRNWVRQAA